jgi:tetratricopeptide (TPR) repeat protein
VAELADLSEWLADAEAPTLNSIVAIGGIGKSALTWHWFHSTDVTGAQLDGRLWWSFYEADSGYDQFVVHTLAYISGRPVSEISAMSPIDRENDLLDELDSKKHLLVLDGVERILIAYAHLDFAHMSEEDLDRRTNNPFVAPRNRVVRDRLRRTIDPNAEKFLRRIARSKGSRVLMTSRLLPAALETETGKAWPGSRYQILQGLDPADAVELWRLMGVSGSEAEIRDILASIGYHPLLSRALAGEVADHRPAPGDLEAWRRANPRFNPFRLRTKQAQSHVLAYALAGLQRNQRAALEKIAAFRTPVDYTTMSALFVQRENWRAEDLHQVLKELEDRGLVGWDRARNCYDMHPIVRGVVWNDLDEIQRKLLLGDLEQHFSAVSVENEHGSIAQAHAAIELTRALIGLGRFDDAAAVYFERLHGVRNFGFVEARMGHDNIALLEGMFPDGVEAAPGVSKRYAVAITAQLGHAYDNAGRLLEAYNLAARAADMSNGRLEQVVLARRAASLGRRGEISKYVDVFTADRINDRAGRRRFTMARVYTMLSHDPDVIISLGRHLETLFSDSPGERWAQSYLGRNIPAAATISHRLHRSVVDAEMALHRGDASAAISDLNAILREARSAALVEPELQALRVLTEAHCQLGDTESARTCLSDLVEAAGRGPYRLILERADRVRERLKAGPGPSR